MDRIDDCELRRVGNGDTLRHVVAGASPIGREIESIAIGDRFCTEDVGSESGNKVKCAVLDKRVVIGVGCPFEFPVSIAVQTDLTGPGIQIKTIGEVVVQYQASVRGLPLKWAHASKPSTHAFPRFGTDAYPSQQTAQQ